jgi:hypothetical protein
MRTVAEMISLTPVPNRRLIGEMAMYKFLHRYLTLATENSMLSTDEQSDIQRFILTGWMDSTRDADIASMLTKTKQGLPTEASL